MSQRSGPIAAVSCTAVTFLGGARQAEVYSTWEGTASTSEA